MLLREPLLSLLRDLGKIRWKKLDELLAESEDDCSRFCEIAIRDNLLRQDEAGKLVADTLELTYLNLSQTIFDKELATRLPREVATRHVALPVYKLGAAITVAMEHPRDVGAISDLEKLLGAAVLPAFSFSWEIKSAIHDSYAPRIDGPRDGGIVELDAFATVEASRLIEMRPAVALVDSILWAGLKEGASDVHIEPKELYTTVRFRVDGMLKPRARIPNPVARGVVARIKVLSNLDLSESRIPQDGRLSFQTPRKKVDVRVSTLPVIYGEKVVLRLLGSMSGEVKLDLKRLSISQDILDALTKMLDEPNGIIFVTGPTGSGKSTTLYASLGYTDSPECNLTTIEDPVEYEIATLNQSSVDVKAGRTFHAILRSILRQDPDIVLVGEIRDAETARIATQAALTGHLVLSSLHTNNALQAMTRLLDMGIEPYVVAPAVLGVLGQRLVRKLCPRCKEAYSPDDETLARHFTWTGERPAVVLYRPKGCPACKEMGYRGRLGIHEVFQITAEVREAILRGKSYNELRTLAYASGFKDMRFDGFRKAFEGHTTIEEILRVTASE